MSTFFRALERAEQERALRNPAPPTEAQSAPPQTAPPAIPQAAPVQAPQSVFRPPQPVVIRLESAAEVEERATGVEEHLVSLLAPNSFEAEQYRALRHMVDQLRRSSDLSIIAVSSPDAGDGKTTTTINLAGALAQAHDTRVLLIDGDLRGANLASHLGIDDHAAPGLVDAILDPTLSLAAIAQVQPHLNLSVIAAGRRSSAPYEVLKSPRVGELLEAARAQYDYVIVDTPPLVSVPDSRVLAKWVDGFLIVVAAHRTPRKLVEEALNLLEASKIVGMVFNGDDHHVSMGSYSSRRRNIVRGRTGRRHSASE